MQTVAEHSSMSGMKVKLAYLLVLWKGDVAGKFYSASGKLEVMSPVQVNPFPV